MKIRKEIAPSDLKNELDRFWQYSAEKLALIREEYDLSQGSPVFTQKGKYTTRGWTEWTQGFQFGSEILQFDATSDTGFLEIGRKATLEKMAGHLTHTGVHDHGFNNVSTYGNLLRLCRAGRCETDQWQEHFYELALKTTGAVQASRWTETDEGDGFIYSFNGPQSLFVDTLRTLRALALSWSLGHTLLAEHDESISLLRRLVQHARSTARYSVYYGEGRDAYDTEPGRTVHEAIFNTNDGYFRCPSTQQGYSPFSTWTRGLAWAICGFGEQLEFLETVDDAELEPFGGANAITSMMLKAARATCDFYIANTSKDGIPFWDTGAPNLHKVGDYTQKDANPFNPHEPVDSSAAAIAAQGLLRLGHYLGQAGDSEEASKYTQAGLTVTQTLLKEPYVSTDASHQGLLLHSIYHHPNGWDFVPADHKIPHREACMWGDYHMRELALYVSRLAHNQPYYTFFNNIRD